MSDYQALFFLPGTEEFKKSIYVSRIRPVSPISVLIPINSHGQNATTAYPKALDALVIWALPDASNAVRTTKRAKRMAWAPWLTSEVCGIRSATRVVHSRKPGSFGHKVESEGKNQQV
jgi:hypothetical protein